MPQKLPVASIEAIPCFNEVSESQCFACGVDTTPDTIPAVIWQSCAGKSVHCYEAPDNLAFSELSDPVWYSVEVGR